MAREKKRPKKGVTIDKRRMTEIQFEGFTYRKRKQDVRNRLAWSADHVRPSEIKSITFSKRKYPDGVWKFKAKVRR